jgi:hypothetical protein
MQSTTWPDAAVFSFKSKNSALHTSVAVLRELGFLCGLCSYGTLNEAASLGLAGQLNAGGGLAVLMCLKRKPAHSSHYFSFWCWYIPGIEWVRRYEELSESSSQCPPPSSLHEPSSALHDVSGNLCDSPLFSPR